MCFKLFASPVGLWHFTTVVCFTHSLGWRGLGVGRLPHFQNQQQTIFIMFFSDSKVNECSYQTYCRIVNLRKNIGLHQTQCQVNCRRLCNLTEPACQKSHCITHELALRRFLVLPGRQAIPWKKSFLEIFEYFVLHPGKSMSTEKLLILTENSKKALFRCGSIFPLKWLFCLQW